MRKLVLLISLIVLWFTGFSQNTSPLVVKDFMLMTNGIFDIDQVPKDARTDWDSNPVCMVQVRAVGFDENLMQKFTFVPNGMEIMHKTIKNGMVILYVSSNKMGEITIKYMGDCLFKLPYKLDGHKIYVLTLGMETATLVIRSVPTDADIFIDNEKVGTGYASKAVSIGAEHRYKVQCEYYWPVEDVVYFDKRDKKELNINLEPNFGFITIKSEPAGADVFVDDKKVGVTPYLTKKITLGTHVVELRKTGYESHSDVVNIKAGEVNKQFENVKLEKDKNYVEQQIVQNNQSYPTVTSAPIINGVFSVSATKKVNFSKGNLQYQASTNTWRFAEYQWEIIGKANSNISSSYSGWIDLFGWGTGNNPTKSSKNDTDYRSFSDWGNNTISNGGVKKWFTLTNYEWLYVCDKRNTSSGIRYAKAIVNGVRGLILLPDNWSSSYYSLNDTNKFDASYNNNTISQQDWTSMLEANGAVFLPAAGYRIGTDVDGVGYDGGFWSATQNNDGENAYSASFYLGNFSKIFLTRRGHGHSVRLVSLAED